MKSYIVRVYRCHKKIPRSLVGVVEEVGAKGKKAFTNYDELWEILHRMKKDGVRRKKDRGLGKHSGENEKPYSAKEVR